jgi:YHS domain-containing protein
MTRTSKSPTRRLALAAAVVLAFAPVVIATPAYAAKPAVSVGFASNAAVRGYDTVAYFTAGAPTKGDARYTTMWNGAQWSFSSAANRDLFKANPERYAPQYGGYCAWAVSQGYTAGIDPTAWKIVDGKLYLNYNREIQQRWEKNIPGNIAAANKNWPSVLK